MIGRSLAINSAQSERMNSVMKIQKDQKPRRLRLKLSKRRRLMGESFKKPFCSRTGARGAEDALVNSGEGAVLISHLPRFKIDARIDPCVGEVGEQIHHEAEQRKNIEIGKDHRIIAVDDRFIREQAQAIERENTLDQQ